MATDITSSVANFREAARHLWNCHYIPILNREYPFDTRDSFDRVTGELFCSLVLEELDLAELSLAPASAHADSAVVRDAIEWRGSDID